MCAEFADSSHSEFVSEPILPKRGSFDSSDMGRALPGLPAEFTWRDESFCVRELLEKWKMSGPEVGRMGGERYLRRHYFRVKTTSGHIMVLYCERNTRNRTRPKSRWWLYTIQHPK